MEYKEIWEKHRGIKDVETINKMMNDVERETETECCHELLRAFNIESVPSNIDTFEKVIAYIKSQIKLSK